MKKVLIYAGTTEGRKLAEQLSAAGIPCVCCVATQYGSMVMREDEKLSPLIDVRQGRLEAPDMAAFEGSGEFFAVVDATHPFAAQVTANILQSEQILRNRGIQIPFFRLERDTDSGLTKNCALYDSVHDCAAALEGTEGKILLTTGSKELPAFCMNPSLRERLVARVLPGTESVQQCYRAGLTGAQIIAMQGPFSKEMNTAIFHQYNIRQLVTKESGKAGGMQDKISAALENGIHCHVIRKPDARPGGLDGPAILQKICTMAGVERSAAPAGKGSPDRAEIFLIGIGPGSPDFLTAEAKSVLKGADYIFGAPRMIAPFHPAKRKEAVFLPAQVLPELKKALAESEGTIRVAMLFSGDSGFFSGCRQMAEALSRAGYDRVRILPGISSLQLLSARTGIAWQDAGIVSLHGKDPEKWRAEVMSQLCGHQKVFFLTSGAEDVGKLCTFLKQQGRENAELFLGRQLSYPQERIFHGTAGEFCSFPKGQKEDSRGLYCGFILQENKRRKLTHSIPDSFFTRGKVPMTKSEVRTLCVEHLNLKENSVFYDIGSGTGSVAVEAASLSPSVSVYAVEMLDSALDLIRQNKEKARAFNINVISGKAPDALKALPPADCAFIGGSSGKLGFILEALYAKNPAMRIVMTAVTLETIAQMTQCMHRFPVTNEEVLQVSVSRAAILGNYRLMRAENPIYIFSFDFRPDT